MGSDKIKKVQLQMKDDTICSVFGIVSPDPGYKLSFGLNNLLGISLKSDAPVVIEEGNGDEMIYARFCDLSALPWTWTALVSNRSENRFLIKKLANIDYLLLRFDDTESGSSDMEFAASIRESAIINGIFVIEKSLIDRDILEKLIPHH